MKQTEEKYEVIPDGMNRFDRFTKRAFDILVSAVCLVAFSPLILFCYLAVKLEDGGPAVYKQERIGLHGKAFNILKFRSMRIDAEDGGPKLSSGETDNRLTKVGKMLREHHLDELPQLWNVFRGDMAFIGPRPERQYYINKIMGKTTAIRISIRFVPVSPRMQRSITATPTPSKRWSTACTTTSIICNTALGGLIARFSG